MHTVFPPSGSKYSPDEGDLYFYFNRCAHVFNPHPALLFVSRLTGSASCSEKQSMAVNPSILQDNTSWLSLCNITALFNTPWTLLETKEQGGGGVSVSKTPGLLFRGNSPMDTFHFIAGWVCLTNESRALS